jgi:regulator of nucleoside diphosphate kinase
MKTVILSKLDFMRIMDSIKEGKRNNLITASEADSLLKELRSAKVVDSHEIPADIVTMNSIVRFSFMNNNKSVVFQIVYPDKANIKENKVSIFSSIAAALIGYKAGDEIDWNTPSGPTKIRIDEIVYQPEAAGQYYL